MSQQNPLFPIKRERILTKYVVGANTNPPKNPTNPPKKGKVMPMNIVRAAENMQVMLRNEN